MRAILFLSGLFFVVGAFAAPNAADDLQSIVALCATDAESARFDQAWASWVRDHPQANVDKTIDEVVRRAKTMRSMTLGNSRAGSYRWVNDQIVKRMQRVARGAIRETVWLQPGSPDHLP